MKLARRIMVASLALAPFLFSCGDGGGSSSSVPVAPAPPPPPSPPNTPTNLRVTAQGSDWIEWSWNPVAGAGGYQVQVSENEVFTSTDPIFPVPSASVSYRHRDLVPGTSAYLRVRSTAGSLVSPWSIHRTGRTELRASFIDWTVEDSCFAGVGTIMVRFHRFVAGLHYEEWPSFREDPYSIPVLGSRDFLLRIDDPLVGGEVCFGARDLTGFLGRGY